MCIHISIYKLEVGLCVNFDLVFFGVWGNASVPLNMS